MKVEFTTLEQELIDEFESVCGQVNEWRVEPFDKLHYVYSFSYKGAGVVVSVKCKELNVERDITDYMSW